MSDEEADSPTSNLETELSELRISDKGGCAGGSDEETVYLKGKGSPQKRQRQSDNSTELAQPTQASSAASASGSLLPSYRMQQQQHYNSSSVSPTDPGYTTMQSPAQQCNGETHLQQLPGQQFEELIDGVDALRDLFNGWPDAVPSGGTSSELPGSAADTFIEPWGQAVRMQTNSANAESAAPAAPMHSTTGGNSTLTPETRDALRRKLKPESVLADEKFNSQLHTALLQNLSREEIDNLLCDLNGCEKLVSVINLANTNCQTPLSLCLKMRRADLIPLLINFDAAPTQLCGRASDRTNHFHYAFAKCLDSSPGVQTVQELISRVYVRHQSDLLGLLAKDRFMKTPLDYLNNRIYKLSTSRQDAASTELLSKMQGLKSYVYSVIPSVGLIQQN